MKRLLYAFGLAVDKNTAASDTAPARLDSVRAVPPPSSRIPSTRRCKSHVGFYYFNHCLLVLYSSYWC